MVCYCISLPNSMFSDVMLEPEINHRGNIYITGIEKYYKSDFFLKKKKPIIKHSPTYHHSGCSSLRFKYNRMGTAPSKAVRSIMIRYLGYISISEPTPGPRGK